MNIGYALVATSLMSAGVGGLALTFFVTYTGLEDALNVNIIGSIPRLFGALLLLTGSLFVLLAALHAVFQAFTPAV